MTKVEVTFLEAVAGMAKGTVKFLPEGEAAKLVKMGLAEITGEPVSVPTKLELRRAKVLGEKPAVKHTPAVVKKVQEKKPVRAKAAAKKNK